MEDGNIADISSVLTKWPKAVKTKKRESPTLARVVGAILSPAIYVLANVRLK